MSESALEARLLADALPYCRGRYGDMIRTLLLDEDGSLGLTGDYVSTGSALGCGLSLLKREPARRFFAYGGGFGDSLQELDREQRSFVVFSPSAVALEPSQRARQSMLAG